jgi:hypothetical protein
MAREMADEKENRYMGQWTTPVTAVLEAYVLVSFLIALVMFMMCIRRHGCFVSVLVLFSFPYTLSPSRSSNTDCYGCSISVVADAEEELFDTNNRESVCGMNNTLISTTCTRTLMKISMISRSTVSCPEILLLSTLRTELIVCMTFRGWRGLCVRLEWLEGG